MKLKSNVLINLTEEETYEALENYVRTRAFLNGNDLKEYVVDDADSTCRNGNGAYFFFIRKEA